MLSVPSVALLRAARAGSPPSLTADLRLPFAATCSRAISNLSLPRFRNKWDYVLHQGDWRRPEDYAIPTVMAKEKPKIPTGKKEMAENVSVLPLSAVRELKKRGNSSNYGAVEAEGSVSATGTPFTTQSDSTSDHILQSTSATSTSEELGIDIRKQDLPVSLQRNGLTPEEAKKRNLKRHGSEVPDRAERVTTVYNPDNFDDMPELKSEYFLFADYCLWAAYAVLWSVALFSLYVVFGKNPNLKENRWIWNVGEYVSLFGIVMSIFMCWAVTTGAR
ncbi:unnamed protein product [Amoebophrya sp. A120]|nr:unnamed protein product [Amoebophrya sp. A120]|eukprot:GSA120T00012764001.1